MAAVAAAPSVWADPQSDFKRLSNTFDALYAARKLPEATNTARELVQLSTRMHGAEHPTTLDTIMWLANVLEVQALEEDGNAAQQKRPPDPRMRALREEAITLLKRRFDILVARKGLGDDGVQVAQARLVNVLRAAGRKAEATALVEMRPGGAKPPSAKPATAEAPKKPGTAIPVPPPSPAFAGKTEAELRREFNRLSDEIDALYAARKLPEATNVARKLLALSGHLFGPEHLTTQDVTMWLANLLEIQGLQGNLQAAQDGRPPDPTTRALFEEAARLLWRRFEVLALQRGIGDDDVKVAQERAINTIRSAGGTAPEAPPVAASPGENPYLQKNDPADVTRLFAESKVELAAHHYGKARELASASLAIAEGAYGPKSLVTVLSGVLVGEAERALGNYGAALSHYERALPVLLLAGGSAPGEVLADVTQITGDALAVMAVLYYKRGDYAAAERSLLAALDYYEKSPDKNSDGYATALSSLGSVYGAVGRLDEAEQLYKRVIAIREAGGAKASPELVLSMTNMAALLYSRHDDRVGEVRDWLTRAIGLAEKLYASDPSHPDLAHARAQLATLLAENARVRDLDRAEVLARQALTALQSRLPPRHPDATHAMGVLAAILEQRDRYQEASKLIREAIGQASAAYGNDHPDTVLLRTKLTRLLVRQQQWKEALVPLHEAVEGATGRSRAFALGVLSRPVVGRLVSDTDLISTWMPTVAKIAHRAEAGPGPGREAAMREAFVTAQWSASSTAASVAEMAARGASGSPELAALVRARQDAVIDWQELDRRRAAMLTLPPVQRDRFEEKRLAEKRVAIERRIGDIDKRFRIDFERYAELTAPDALSIDDVQAALTPEEALVLIVPTEALQPMPEETFVWVVTKTEARWVHVEAGRQALADYVTALRCGLDDSAWRGDGNQRCRELLKVGKRPGKDEPLPFSPGIAHELYDTLFGQVRDTLAGKKHLLIVPTGALTRLPFQVLVTEPPQGEGLASVRWLARDKAVTILPSVATLKTLRRVAKPTAATKPMIGFGNPLLDGLQADPEDGDEMKQLAALARERTGCAATPVTRTAALRGGLAEVPQTGGLANLKYLRAQPPLPETADEVCAVARDLSAEADDLRLGARATETEAKRLSASGDLARYRVVLFATHGALASEIRGASEPGLILTPPVIATAEDDGYLSMSEIAGLKLDADWVILSACNTAGSSGKDAAGETLSGVTRAFFFAGARALLVSHWAVETNTTVKLISGAAGESSRNPSMGRAEALRRAMLALIDGGDEVEAHPANWSPFVVVGEGGAGR